MLSSVIAVAGTFDGITFERADPAAVTSYRELRPMTDRFESDYLAASHFDCERLLAHGTDAAHAMNDSARWVRECAGALHPVLVLYCVEPSPFGFD